MAAMLGLECALGGCRGALMRGLRTEGWCWFGVVKEEGERGVAEEE